MKKPTKEAMTAAPKKRAGRKKYDDQWNASDKAKAARARYLQSAKGKAAMANAYKKSREKYAADPQYRARIRRAAEDYEQRKLQREIDDLLKRRYKDS